MYKPNLSAYLLDKAVKELNEPFDNSQRLKAIGAVRKKFYLKYPVIRLEDNRDDFILRFLRARKFNVDRTTQLLTNYHVRYNGWPEVFDKVNSPALIYSSLNAGLFVPLHGKAKDGSTVIIGRPGLAKDADLLDFFASMILTIEKLLEDEATQINGITVIQDLAYFGIDLAKQMSPLSARRFTSIVQNVMPVRVKSLNVTNEPKVFDFVFGVVQPFLSEKMKSRLHIHGTDFTKLYEIVDKSVLPFMFAGCGPNLEPLVWKTKLLSEDTEL